MKVAEFIPAYMAAGNTAVSATTPSVLKARFAAVLHEDVTTLGNDTLMALEFNTTWDSIREFVKTYKPKKP